MIGVESAESSGDECETPSAPIALNSIEGRDEVELDDEEDEDETGVKDRAATAVGSETSAETAAVARLDESLWGATMKARVFVASVATPSVRTPAPTRGARSASR